MRAAFGVRDKLERQTAVGQAKETIRAALSEEEQADPSLDTVIKKLESDVVRGDIRRPRPHVADVGIRNGGEVRDVHHGIRPEEVSPVAPQEA
jgi:polyribonucleotide nucleotidyltransferase